MIAVAISLSFLSILFTVLPFSRSDAWWVRIFDFPRAQVAVMLFASLVLMFVYTNIYSWWSIAVIIGLSAALIHQLSMIIKFTPLYPVEAIAVSKGSNQPSFSILQANLRMENRNSEKFKQLVRKYDPDILSVNEPDDWWADELAELRDRYSYSIDQPQENTYGMMLFSKYPLKNVEINFLVESDVPSFYCTVELPEGKEFDLHCLHPKPPRPGSETFDRDTELLLVGKRISDTNRPAIVVGDLNDVAWSYTSKRFRQFCAVVDPRQGRGTFNTYNVFIPLFRYPLDHFFYTGEFRLKALKKLKAFGSDHFPMYISLCL